MADLSSIERRKLERMFRMGGGYVLDFSDRTFNEFCEEHTRRDIDAPVYRELSLRHRLPPPPPEPPLQKSREGLDLGRHQLG